MVDVGEKSASERQAIADGLIRMSSTTLDEIATHQNKKGDVLSVAQIAGIMAAKRTADLIPLCHPLALTHVSVTLERQPEIPSIYCRATVKTKDRTGVEMEALMAVQTALLTVYDMCKAVDRNMTIEKVQLIEKSGGRSGHWKRESE